MHITCGGFKFRPLVDPERVQKKSNFSGIDLLPYDIHVKS